MYFTRHLPIPDLTILLDVPPVVAADRIVAARRQSDAAELGYPAAVRAAEQRKRRGEGKPDTFDFLEFTHICGTTRKTGRFIVKRQTIRKRLSAKLQALKAELRHR